MWWQGYLSINRLCETIGFTHTGMTAEGDNRVKILNRIKNNKYKFGCIDNDKNINWNSPISMNKNVFNKWGKLCLMDLIKIMQIKIIPSVDE